MAAAARLVYPCLIFIFPTPPSPPGRGQITRPVSRKRGAASPRFPRQRPAPACAAGLAAPARTRAGLYGSGALPAAFRAEGGESKCRVLPNQKKKAFLVLPIKFLFGMQALALPALPCNPFTFSM